MSVSTWNKKKVYVPQAGRGKATRPLPPRELVLLSASTALRSIPWLGVTLADRPVAVAPPAALSPTLTARAAFTTLPWNGETAVATTTVQASHSVAHVMSQFRWE